RSRRLQDIQRLLVLRPAHGGRAPPGPPCRYQEMPAGLGHHHARTQSGVAGRPEGTLLSVWQDIPADDRRAGLARGNRDDGPILHGDYRRYPTTRRVTSPTSVPPASSESMSERCKTAVCASASIAVTQTNAASPRSTVRSSSL